MVTTIYENWVSLYSLCVELKYLYCPYILFFHIVWVFIMYVSLLCQLIHMLRVFIVYVSLFDHFIGISPVSLYLFKETCTSLESPVYSDHNGFSLDFIISFTTINDVLYMWPDLRKPGIIVHFSKFIFLHHGVLCSKSFVL